jgi:hypothetical protein
MSKNIQVYGHTQKVVSEVFFKNIINQKFEYRKKMWMKRENSDAIGDLLCRRARQLSECDHLLRYFLKHVAINDKFQR